MTSSFQCAKCGKFSSTKNNLNRHIRQAHDFGRQNVPFQCLECDSKFLRSSGLIVHLQEDHGKQFNYEHLSMDDMSTFGIWRKEIESKFNVKYVSRGVAKKGILYLYCSRSNDGTGRSKFSVYERQLKKKGSCKSNWKCTSQIKVMPVGKKIEVVWIKTHYGHPEGDADALDDRPPPKCPTPALLDPVTPLRISEQQEEAMEIELSDSYLLPNEDVETVYYLDVDDGSQNKSVNGTFSIDLFVQEDPADPSEKKVLFYKSQGTEMEGFNKDDFCLIVMTNAQAVLAKKYGSNIIAVDGTYDLNFYDFELFTLTVLDEFNQGFPIACLFSNRSDTAVFSHFINIVKDRVGVIQPKTFMSDLYETFYNAWVPIMGESAHVLFSPWHVDRAWQQNLDVIPSTLKRKEVSLTLKKMRRHSQPEVCMDLLSNYISSLFGDESTSTFARYFEKHFSHNYKKWAFCFHGDYGINANIHLESLHKEIEYFRLEKEAVKRLDRGLDVIMKYIRDRTLDLSIKMTEGKRGSRGIFQRHNQSLEIRKQFAFEVINDNEFKLVRLPDKKEYIVNRVSEVCCKRICRVCNICSHCYTCTCGDFKLLTNQSICIHAHLVNLKLSQKALRKFLKNKNMVDSKMKNDVMLNENPTHTTGNEVQVFDENELRNQISQTLTNLKSDDLLKLGGPVLKNILNHLTIVNKLWNPTSENSTVLLDSTQLLDVVNIGGSAPLKSVGDLSSAFSVPIVAAVPNVAAQYQGQNMQQIPVLVCTPLNFVSSSSKNDHSYA